MTTETRLQLSRKITLAALSHDPERRRIALAVNLPMADSMHDEILLDARLHIAEHGEDVEHTLIDACRGAAILIGNATPADYAPDKADLIAAIREYAEAVRGIACDQPVPADAHTH